MAMRELIPWKKNNDRLALRRREMDPLGELRQEIDQIFNGFLGDWTGRMDLFDRRVGSSRPGVSPEAPVDPLRIPNCELAGAVVLVVQLAYDPGPRIPRPVIEGIRVFRDDVDGAGARR